MEKFKPAIFYIIFFIFVLAFSTTATSYDYDLWARLIAGMSVVQSGIVLKQDFLSYTPTHTWYDHEWGSGVIFYLAQHFFSSAGILILQAILIFAIFFIITKIVKLKGVKTTSAYNFLFYFFAFSAMSQTLNEPVRCQLFTFLFFTLYLYILEKAKKGENKPLFAIPFIMIFWNNVHAGCVSGIGIIFLYALGEFLNKKPFKKYLIAMFSAIIVLPINPWGVDYIRFLFEATTMPRPNILEWLGLFSDQFVFKFMKFKIFASALLLTQIVTIIKQIKEKNYAFDKTKWLVILSTLYLATIHVKLIPFAVIAMTCFFYDDFYSVFNSLTKNIFNRFANTKEIIVYLLIAIFAFANINAKSLEPILNWYKYPIRAVEFIKINDIKGNILCNFGQGSYVSYKLYPNNKIFMDGRYEEVYYNFMIPLLNQFYLGIEKWDEILKHLPPDVILIEKNYPIFSILQKQKDWKLVFEDKFFGVFVKKKNANKKYKTPSEDLNYYKNTLFDTKINFVLQSKHEH